MSETIGAYIAVLVLHVFLGLFFYYALTKEDAKLPQESQVLNRSKKTTYWLCFCFCPLSPMCFGLHYIIEIQKAQRNIFLNSMTVEERENYLAQQARNANLAIANGQMISNNYQAQQSIIQTNTFVNNMNRW